MDIGIYGGTFDPVHRGHVRLLQCAAEACGLDRTIILPDRIPPHKQSKDLVSGEDRLEMCRRAFADTPRTEVSDWEIRQEGLSYSVLTLEHFHGLYPEDRLWFIMGSDMLTSFHQWYRYEDILKLSGLICMSRYNDDHRELEAAAEGLREKGGEVKLVEAQALEMSSSQIRQLIAEGGDCTELLAERVLDYIKEKGLYGVL